MEPGGSHGLQNRSRPDFVGLGGFDSHALPPFSRHLPELFDMTHAVRSHMLGVALLVLLATPVRGQRPDTARAPITVSTAQQYPSPITPRRAFFYSFLAPGYSQSVLGRHKAAAAFVFVEALSLIMIRESAADVHEARRTVNDSIIVAYGDGSGNTNVVRSPPFFEDRDVAARSAHVEDWIAFLIANHLFAGADAFVAAHLWDVRQRLGLRVFPQAGRTTLTASIKW
jgi:hypothetical protein